MPIVKVKLKPSERTALQKLARRELRDPRTEAALLIRRALEQERLLEPTLDSGEVKDAIQDGTESSTQSRK